MTHICTYVMGPLLQHKKQPGRTHIHLIDVSGMLVCVNVCTRMQLGHMGFNSECYLNTLSGHAVKVNSWIIYIRLVKRSTPITWLEAPCYANPSLPHTYQQLTLSRTHAKKGRLTSYRRECTRQKGGEGTERKNV